MTTLRPERPADGPMSYEDTGQFRAVVESLDDPLNDPLPGRGPSAAEPSPQPRQQPSPQQPSSFGQEYGEPAGYESPTGYEASQPPQVPGQSRPAPPAPPVQQAPTSPWFRAAGTRPEAFQPPAAPQPAFPQPTFPHGATDQPVFEQPLDQPVDRQGFERPPFEQPPVERPDLLRPEHERSGIAAAGLAPEAVPGPVPGREAVGETAQLPVLDEPGGQGEEEPAAAPTHTSTAATAPLPADGGRAARRKAARQGSGGGGHRARGHAGGTAAVPAEAAGAPMSRVQARMAQRAAKESPAVVLSRVVGELFITLGVLMLLFVVYQLWWTNVRAHAEANGAANHLQKEWNSASNDPHRAPGVFQPGQGFAIMYIPKLDVKAPIAQGVSKTKVLDKGEIGHYDGALNTAMPWDRTGNFAVAAHRNTHGEPFRYINHLVPGDKVVVETANAYYTYVITSSLPSTPPSNTSVLRPIPVGSGFTKPGRYLTLTTCTPEFTSKNRLIVWGRLIEERPRSKGKPDALMEG